MSERDDGRWARVLARFDGSTGEHFALSLLAIVLAVLVGAAFVAVTGYDPVSVYYYLFVGAFGSGSNVISTLGSTTVLLLAGLSVAIAFQADLFNIGTQGQLVLGGLASAVVVSDLTSAVSAGPVTGGVLIAVGLVVGALTGGVWGALPGAMKAYADANEVITTIMLNIIANGLAFTYVKTVIAKGGPVHTALLPPWARLGPVLSAIVPRTASFSSVAFVGTLLIAAGLYYLLNYSAFGYDVRVSGLQEKAARYSGVDAKRLVVSTMTLSGALGGLAGAVYVSMSLGYWTPGLPSYGFDGITVSVLAMDDPLGAIPAALLFGALRSGSLSLSLNTAVPKQLVAVLRGLIILFIAMPGFIRLLLRSDRFGIDRWTNRGGARETEGGS